MSKDGKLIFAGIAVAPGGVDVIDAATMKNIKTIKVRGAVHNVYVTPDGKWVVSGSVGSRVLTVINRDTLEVAWDHTFDKGVRCMTFDTAPDGSAAHVYLQLSDVHGFAVLDLRRMKKWIASCFPTSPRSAKSESAAPSHGIGITPDKKTLAVDSSIANGVFFYSMPDLKVIGFVPTGPTPDWLTFTPDSKMVYIANAGANNCVRRGHSGAQSRRDDSGGRSPQAERDRRRSLLRDYLPLLDPIDQHVAQQHALIRDAELVAAVRPTRSQKVRGDHAIGPRRDRASPFRQPSSVRDGSSSFIN